METKGLIRAFETELNLTEKGFIDLEARKKDLIIDVSNEAGFKLARKERTEQNAVLKNIDRLAIDGKAEIDLVRNSLKDRVSSIYAVNVTAFEVEDARQQEVKRIEKEKEAKRIQAMHDEINSIKQFASNLFGKTSEDLSSLIEAVDLIDVHENFAELTQEAIQVKRETLTALNQALSSAMHNEEMARERDEAMKREREMQKRIDELQAKVIAETVSEQFNDHFPDAGNMVNEPLPEVHAPELVEEYSDVEWLEFIRERLVNVYGESALCDHIIKLNKIINNMRDQ